MHCFFSIHGYLNGEKTLSITVDTRRTTICACGKIGNSSPQIHAEKCAELFEIDSICFQKDNIWACFVSPCVNNMTYNAQQNESYYNPENWDLRPRSDKEFDFYIKDNIFEKWGEVR